jgi:SH3 domain protein
MLVLMFVVGIVVGICGTPVRAETRYVGNDEFKLLLRSGPGDNRKIIDMISIGERLDVLEDGEEYSLVRLPDGKEGYVLKRYLSSQKPSRLALAELQNSHGQLSQQSDALLQENEALKAANAQINASLQEKTKSLTDLTRNYNDLKESSEASNFQMRKYLIFFLSGAGLLFIGVLLGLVMKRQRRKSMYMV